MKLNRRQFMGSSLSALGMALASRKTGAAANDRPPKNLIVLACFGGWDAASVLDPKSKGPVVLMPGEDAQAGNINYRSLQTSKMSTKGDWVATFFNRYYDQVTVLRGIDVGSLAHAACRVRILTGTDDATLPDFAAITASELGYDRPLPYIDLGGNGYMGPLGRLVGRFGVDSQITALVEPTAKWSAEYLPADGSPIYVPGDADEDAIANYVLGRAQEQLGARAKLGYNNDRVEDFIEAYGRASQLEQHKGQLPEPGKFTQLMDQVEQVPTLLLGDPMCQAIFLDSRLPWDTHFNNDVLQFQCYQTAFEALSVLVAGVEDSGLLDDTLIVVLSEMGRTPNMNAAGGKDHWPTTTALLIGGGLQGNRVIGETDEFMNAQHIDFATGEVVDAKNGMYVTSADFIASILDWVGVRATDWLPEGQVITALANA
jgi:hypothetical protein